MKSIHIVKVVSRDVVSDALAEAQNLFGMNLRAYEKMIDKGIEQIKEDLGQKRLKWFRYEITQLAHGAIAIMLYGELEEDDENGKRKERR